MFLGWLYIEGPSAHFDHILVVAIELWRNSAKWRYLYSNPEKYLSGQPCIEVEHDTMVS